MHCAFSAILYLTISYFGDTNSFTYIDFLDDISSTNDIIYKDEYLGSILKYGNSTLLFNCRQLFNTSTLKVLPMWPPPKLSDIPVETLMAYTFNKQIEMGHWYLSPKPQVNGSGYVWSFDLVATEFISNPKRYCYNNKWCTIAFAKYKAEIKDKLGLVVGSQSPWAEGALLHTGAKHIITMEYMPIRTNHPQLTTITPSEVDILVMRDQWTQVDFVFCYSSIEHDGLGRYGDKINPAADLESIAKFYCLLRPGGMLFLGLPMGLDAVVFNAHRVYGKIRLKLLLSIWELVDIVGYHRRLPHILTYHEHMYQPLLILRKKNISISY